MSKRGQKRAVNAAPLRSAVKIQSMLTAEIPYLEKRNDKQKNVFEYICYPIKLSQQVHNSSPNSVRTKPLVS